MTHTTEIIPQRIEVYKSGEFIGYVNRVFPRGNTVLCYIGQKPITFNTRRATSVKRSAAVASVCYVENSSPLYPSKDNLEFRAVNAENA